MAALLVLEFERRPIGDLFDLFGPQAGALADALDRGGAVLVAMLHPPAAILEWRHWGQHVEGAAAVELGGWVGGGNVLDVEGGVAARHRRIDDAIELLVRVLGVPDGVVGEIGEGALHPQVQDVGAR